jgi:hypothetical protein
MTIIKYTTEEELAKIERENYIKANPHLINVPCTLHSLLHHYPSEIRREGIKKNLLGVNFDSQKEKVKKLLLICIAQNYHGAFDYFVIGREMLADKPKRKN